MDVQKDTRERRILTAPFTSPLALILPFPVKDVMGLLASLPKSSWGQHTTGADLVVQENKLILLKEFN